ncbi:MAG: hypothetical protein JSV31_10635, partial [Desulfobacterales bacterium]
MEKTDFEKWKEEFERSKNGEAAIQFMIDNLEGKYGEDPSKELSAQENLKNWILKACYNAKNYKDTCHNKREHDKYSIEEIKGEGRNQIKAIKELRKFIKNYPNAANYAMGIALENLYLESIVIVIEREKLTERLIESKERVLIKRLDESKRRVEQLLDKILAAYESGLEKYIPFKNVIYWFQDGCLLFPKPIDKKRVDPVIDSLIFEIAFYLKRYISNRPTMVIEPGMPFPKTKHHLKAQNEIIAKFVTAIFLKPIGDKHVKQR